MAVSCILSDIKRDGRKSQFCIPAAFDDAVRGSPWNIASTFGVEKLEWCGYPMVKSGGYFSRFDTIRACDGRTDGHLATA